MVRAVMKIPAVEERLRLLARMPAASLVTQSLRPLEFETGVRLSPINGTSCPGSKGKAMAATAIADKALASAVATHKSLFLRERKADDAEIDYAATVQGKLKLVPMEDRLEELHKDYEAMIADGFLLDEAESFDALIKEISELQDSVNKSVD